MISGILVVCTGNTCRSPMAAALLQRQLAQHPHLAHIRVESAACGEPSGRSANSLAIGVMHRRNIDLTGHRPRQVTDRLVQQADLVLTMTAAHAAQLRRAYPALAGQISPICEYAGSSEVEVADPMPIATLEAYADCAAQLERLGTQVGARLTQDVPGR